MHKKHRLKINSPNNRKTLLLVLAIAPAPVFIIASFLFPQAVPIAAVSILVAAAVGLNIWTMRTPCHTCGRRMALEQFVQRDMTIGAKCSPAACAYQKDKD